MNILAIETATDVCSVAMLVHGRIVACMSVQKARLHSERLVPMIGECLVSSGLALSNVDAVAISAGPGSYTGLRIGASTAKGLVFSTTTRLIGVPTLEAMAYPLLAGYTDPVVPLLASRRGEYYVAAFDRDNSGSVRRLLSESIVSEADLIARIREAGVEHGIISIPGPITIRHEGPADSSQNTSADPDSARPEDRFSLAIADHFKAEETFRVKKVAVSAENIAFCAVTRLERQLFDDASTFEPYYLRAFEARKPSRSIFDRLPF